MAQALGRKTMIPSEIVSRPIAVKAFGDAPMKQTKSRNKSSTKIPKTLRHELESALVNLCDIWFEEIKPHLIRNKIKLHVHAEQAGGEGAKHLPPGAPGCSHLDPGAASDLHRRRNANCVDCSPPQRTASRAQYRRPPPRPTTPPRRNLSPVPENCSFNRHESLKRKPRKRNHRDKQSQSEGRLRVSRLCQNLDFSPLPNKTLRKRKSRFHPEYINSIHIKNRTRNQSTQTEDSKLFNSVPYNIPSQLF